MNCLPVDITETFADLFVPCKALIMYRRERNSNDIYIETFDCRDGKMMNAHPLSLTEIKDLADALDTKEDEHRYLFYPSLLPETILHVNYTEGRAMWYTPPQKISVRFTRNLQLPDGELYVPALLWNATPRHLALFGLTNKARPDAQTMLYHAPFLNIYDNGDVCMGTVDTQLNDCESLQDFMASWQDYFFNSRFSHFIGEEKSTKTPLLELYQNLLSTLREFPTEELIPTGKTIQDIL